MPGNDGLVVALLGAGRSSRFGREDKLLATLGGRPLIAWAAQAGLGIPAARHLVIAGPDARLSAACPGYVLLPNPHPEDGLASSLRIAAGAARGLGATALLILLADMPFVDAGHLAGLVTQWDQDGSQPLFSRAPGGPPQPPALFPAAFLPMIETLQGDRGARALAGDALIVEAPADRMIDIDTPADLARAANYLRALDPGEQA
ncbi:MobA-related protein [Sphingobium sp. SYK-6]|uniref:NTP transferase domain-containing protein n=1 Tax=Sphingobium sp. (strain NBRC 103272 / SYK-6) TaxID=627192 RepID=UPI0002276FE7|nr:NTP transferase domain-containing protein [Sphingobium sp. SYK-6]BAK66295.1 MobA-related protein [Sphingobium sp. SYK-6]